MGRRMFAIVAALTTVLATATALVTTAPAGATGSDGLQTITVSTTPTGAVTVGQSFSLDVDWSGGGAPVRPAGAWGSASRTR